MAPREIEDVMGKSKGKGKSKSKPSPRTIWSLRLPPATIARVRAAARRERVSATELVERYIGKGLGV